ncbi:MULTISPECIES: cell division protein ZapA [unclassified Aureispira]|uniref:cell division protein ZapA n=1 Tax=unclassified Aureispira TaxID=2649989 RepID=UPI00069650BD|nr:MULTISPECIES: cell division protein ZapA [unclassified Aureispira]WMX14297.1 cell division protein ZapA [Aureispira sp. CCB-E]
MDEDNLLTIPVVLAGRTYPVMVTQDEVEGVTLINQQLNKEFLDLQRRYANKLNKQDILSMLLLTYAKDLHEERQKKDLAPIKERIESIEDILEQVFEN